MSNLLGLHKGGKIMKKTALISGMGLAVFLFVSQGLYAQRLYRYYPAMEDVLYDLNLTEEQLEEIDKLDVGLEKELLPLFSKLRSRYGVLDELETQRDPDPGKINTLWDAIFKLEEDIQNKEILHENKIRELLTEEQRAVLDSYFSSGTIPYGRGGFGRGYFGSGFRGGDYRYAGYGFGAGAGRNGLGRGAGRLGRVYYGGRGNIARGRMGYFGRGAGLVGYGRFLRGARFGFGPCGAGLGRWYRWNDYRSGWNR
jgi:hypothetical protein